MYLMEQWWYQCSVYKTKFLAFRARGFVSGSRLTTTISEIGYPLPPITIWLKRHKESRNNPTQNFHDEHMSINAMIVIYVHYDVTALVALLLQEMDPALYEHLKANDLGDLLFCHR